MKDFFVYFGIVLFFPCGPHKISGCENICMQMRRYRYPDVKVQVIQMSEMEPTVPDHMKK